MSDAYRVTLRTVDGGPTALGVAGAHSLVVDRPAAAGGSGLGFNGGQLLYLAIAACWSNDLYREAAARGITLHRVAVAVDGDFPGRGAASSEIRVDVQVEADADDAALRELLAEVERVAEIPATLARPTTIAIHGEVNGQGR
jgi:organic hydroperoxide reductase OsmC/OhrA